MRKLELTCRNSLADIYIRYRNAKVVLTLQVGIKNLTQRPQIKRYFLRFIKLFTRENKKKVCKWESKCLKKSCLKTQEIVMGPVLRHGIFNPFPCRLIFKTRLVWFISSNIIAWTPLVCFRFDFARTNYLPFVANCIFFKFCYILIYSCEPHFKVWLCFVSINFV